MKTLTEQLDYARKILDKHHDMLPAQVASGQIDQAKADFKIDCMESIVATFEKMLMLEQVSEEMKAQYRKNNPLMVS